MPNNENDIVELGPVFAQKDPRNWEFHADMNHDGAITISDVDNWAEWIFFYPGDWLIKYLTNDMNAVARFFEISYNDYGGLLSGIISSVCWLAILFTVGAITLAVEDWFNGK
ncbi:hypothetical protein TspCOW1_21410 [Thiohalobacter sp. COW1]|uniref:hypothetical protein n=1 Tax=Thiohalobacter sp. COW1 TaxID=2795687 RepID=UPI001916C138|nr:hypothetical protein [Thiohalobacter sp. COW1]BCO32038.1 hypothetical protein TspCOW1_21410 [Thiohalobacter sp. COW1]